ncbi:MAG: substrate-binding domain-containing protein [Planctomycetes bacterium]|nr:substrate-binding domain-containing protein [Planctomycetota bacterium]
MSTPTLVDAQDDTVRQTDQVTTLVENGVDALIINIVETTAAPRLIEAAKVRNIPIVFVNRNPFFNVGDGQPAENCWVVSSNSILEGAVGMEYVGEKLGGKGNIVILMGMLGQEAATNRTEGVRQVIREKYPEIKVLASETGNWFRDQGMSVMENYITAYGDQINAVCSNNDEMAIGAALALQANGMRDKRCSLSASTAPGTASPPSSPALSTQAPIRIRSPRAPAALTSPSPFSAAKTRNAASLFRSRRLPAKTSPNSRSKSGEYASSSAEIGTHKETRMCGPSAITWWDAGTEAAAIREHHLRHQGGTAGEGTERFFGSKIA